MFENHTVTVIGAGNIGRALIGGLLTGPGLDPEQICATRRSPSALAELSKQFPGLRTTSDNTSAVERASIVILAVKPQQIAEVLQAIRSAVRDDVLVISVLAGISTRTLEESFGRAIAVVRAMPNTPALVDEGATTLCGGRHATEEHLVLAQQIFGAVGIVEIVSEDLMDAVTGLSGSGPAYVYMFIEALTDAGVKQGLPRPVAARLSAQTVYGAARLAIETEKHPAILRDEVTTPGGTAIAAVAELESHGLRTMLINAVATATQRSRELSNIQD